MTEQFQPFYNVSVFQARESGMNCLDLNRFLIRVMAARKFPVTRVHNYLGKNLDFHLKFFIEMMTFLTFKVTLNRLPLLSGSLVTSTWKPQVTLKSSHEKTDVIYFVTIVAIDVFRL